MGCRMKPLSKPPFTRTRHCWQRHPGRGYSNGSVPPSCRREFPPLASSIKHHTTVTATQHYCSQASPASHLHLKPPFCVAMYMSQPSLSHVSSLSTSQQPLWLPRRSVPVGNIHCTHPVPGSGQCHGTDRNKGKRG